MRASHADREHVLATLKAAFVQGRLDKAEFDLRVSRTFTSRTYADLAAVTLDLPAGTAEAQPAMRARAKGGRPGQIVAIATMLYEAGWLYVLLAAAREDTPGLVMAYLGTVVYLCVLIVAAGAALEARLDKNGRRPVRPGPATAGG